MERSHSWSIAEDWKSSGPKAHQGSNPCLSASILRAAEPKGSCGLFFGEKESEKEEVSPGKSKKFGSRSAELCELQIFVRKRFIVIFSFE